MKENFYRLLRDEVRNQAGDELEILLTPINTDCGSGTIGLQIRVRGEPFHRRGEHSHRKEESFQRKAEQLPRVFELKDWYEEYSKGKSIVLIAEEIVALYRGGDKLCRSRGLGGDKDGGDIPVSFPEARGQILFKLIHCYQNRELLSYLPHIRFLDLALVFYCNVPVGPEMNEPILIDHERLSQWAVNRKTLCLNALQNTPTVCLPFVQSMEDVVKMNLENIIRAKFRNQDEKIIREMVGKILKNKEPGSIREQVRQSDGRYKMYVLTNVQKMFGAAAILYPRLLKRFADRLGTNLFLLPSSIHEFILVPDDHLQNVEELLKMVDDVNNNKVRPKDILSYSVYYFDRECDEITVV